MYTGDYYNEMCAGRFEKWWNEQLLSNIPSSSELDQDEDDTMVRMEKAYHTLFKVKRTRLGLW